MNIAIIGAGISGLTAAYRLRSDHEVTVYEAGNYVGGHTHTVDVEVGGERYAIDTGFIVYNERTYPNFCRLLHEWNVPSQPSEMSFSVRSERTGREYAGTNLNGLFAQRRNLVRPRFWRLLRDWLRFGRTAQPAVAELDETTTVSDFFSRHAYSQEFINEYFLPMGSAIWSCPLTTFNDFPMKFIVDFYANHGLLSLHDRPQWRVIQGGSREYVRAALRQLPQPIRTNTPIKAILREPNGVRVVLANNSSSIFEHVIVACHSDQALRLLGDQATPLERELLTAFPYQENSVVLHTDTSLLPRIKRAWASWNYLLLDDAARPATVTYNMNRLQGIRACHTFCVTLNADERINPQLVLRRFTYHHPIFKAARFAAQRRRQELIDHDRISYCGAYWGNGFHEDGVKSALAVCEFLQRRQPNIVHREPITLEKGPI